MYDKRVPHNNKTRLSGNDRSSVLDLARTGSTPNIASVDQTVTEPAFGSSSREMTAVSYRTPIRGSLFCECHRWKSNHVPMVTTVTGIVTAQYIQNSGDTVHCSSSPAVLGVKWKKLMLKSACDLSARVWRDTSRGTYAYICAWQEQHAEDTDGFSGLPVTLRG